MNSRMLATASIAFMVCSVIVALVAACIVLGKTTCGATRKHVEPMNISLGYSPLWGTSD